MKMHLVLISRGRKSATSKLAAAGGGGGAGRMGERKKQ